MMDQFSTSQLQNYPIREVNEVISTTPPYVVKLSTKV